MYDIRIIRPAQSDIRDIYRYIAEELKDPVAAACRITLIDKAIISLHKNPLRVPLVRESYLASKGYRLLTVKNHIVFFIIREEIKTISIMRVLYARRDWMRILRIDAEALSEDAFMEE